MDLNIVANGVSYISSIDAKTLEIQTVQLTSNKVSEAQVLGNLLDQIPQDEQIDFVYTDGAYDAKSMSIWTPILL